MKRCRHDVMCGGAVIAVLMCLIIPIVLAEADQELNAGEPGCDQKNKRCAENAKCESSTCKIKFGQSCNETTDTRCQFHSECVAIGGGDFKCLKPYKMHCKEPIECQTTENEECLSTDEEKKEKKNIKRCLCNAHAFYDQKEEKCLDAERLKVTGLHMSGQHQETAISVVWSAPPNITDVEFAARLSSSGKIVQCSKWSNSSSFLFTNLDQGTKYEVRIISQTKRNRIYIDTGDLYVNASSKAVTVFTKPAKPGALLHQKISGAIVAFTASQGHVDKYDVNVTNATGTFSSQNTTVNKHRVMAAFGSLRPKQTYTVTMTAKSHGIISETRIENVSTRGSPAEKVTELIETGHARRWAALEWKKPVIPNGEIRGYTVKLIAKQICSSGISIKCPNCTFSDPEVTPATTSCRHSSSESRTFEQLNDAQFKIAVNMTSLTPGFTYKVQVVAFNEERDGMKNEEFSVRTDPEPADNIRKMQVEPVGPGELKVTWEPGEERGENITYTVTWREEDSPGSCIYGRNHSKTLQGYNTKEYRITGLFGLWNYRVTVSTTNSYKKAPNDITGTNRTWESYPGPVRNLQLKGSDNDTTKYTLTFDCPEKKQRNGKLVQYRVRSSIYFTNQTNPIRVNSTKSINESTCQNTITHQLDLSAETDYIFYVTMITEGGLEGTEVNSSETIVKPQRPTQIQKPAKEEITPIGTTEHSVTLMVDAEVYCNSKDGVTKSAGLKCCICSNSKTCNSTEAGEKCCVCNGTDEGPKMKIDFDRLPTTSQFNISNGTDCCFRCSDDDFLQKVDEKCKKRPEKSWAERRAVNKGSKVKIIAELPSNKGNISISPFKCTAPGCSQATEPIFVSTLAEGKSNTTCSPVYPPPLGSPFQVLWDFPLTCDQNGFFRSLHGFGFDVHHQYWGLDQLPPQYSQFKSLAFNTEQLLSDGADQTSLQDSLKRLAETGTPGVVLWGDPASFVDPANCGTLKTHVQNVLGPFVKILTHCSALLCQGHGNCVQDLPLSMPLILPPCAHKFPQFHGYRCLCYPFWEGACCQTYNAC